MNDVQVQKWPRHIQSMHEYHLEQLQSLYAWIFPSQEIMQDGYCYQFCIKISTRARRKIDIHSPPWKIATATQRKIPWKKYSCTVNSVRNTLLEGFFLVWTLKLCLILMIVQEKVSKKHSQYPCGLNVNAVW